MSSGDWTPPAPKPAKSARTSLGVYRKWFASIASTGLTFLVMYEGGKPWVAAIVAALSTLGVRQIPNDRRP